jgi:hypothetical protein
VPQWNGGQESLPYQAGNYDYDPNRIGYGMIGSEHWANFFGWAHPINFIEWKSPMNGGGLTSDARAKADMEQYMRNNTPYGGDPIESSFGSNLNWEPPWELRWMYFGYIFNGNQDYLFVAHATYSNDRTIRYVAYVDPFGTFRGWFPVPR